MNGRWTQRFAAAIERPAAAYALAAAGVAAGALLGVLADQVFTDPPAFMAFYPAVLFATVVAGARGGLLAVLLSVAAEMALFHPPTARLLAERGDQLAMFAVTAALMVAIARALRLGMLHGVAAEARFRVAQEGAIDPFVICEPIRADGRIVDFRWTYANPAAERSAPAGVKAYTNRRVREVFPGQTGTRMIARLTGLLAGQGTDELEDSWIIDGDERWMRSFGVRLKNGVAVTYRDITVQRAAEEALREGEAQIRVLINSLPQLLWSSRPEGYCDFFSPQWTRYTGLPPERLFGMGWLETVHPEDRDQVAEVWGQLIAGTPPDHLEYRIISRDGTWRWFSGRVSFVRDETRAIRRWYGSATDITEVVESRRDLEDRVAERTRELEASVAERTRAEASLAQAQRLETVGRLTGGVAHDFNNLLTVIIGGLDMILRRPEDSDRVRRLGEAALAAGRRGERLTRQLLAFSRRQELKLEVTDVALLIAQVEPLVRQAAGEALELIVAAEPGVGACRLDSAQFEAALLNLVVNAADATPSGGVIRVEAKRTRLAQGEVAGAAAGDYVRISVSDSGAGMAPEVLERVFEPFFTTKEVGKGTGLGLAQVFGFVTQCGGAVTIGSVVGSGTTVCLHLPLASQAVRPPAPEPGAALAPGLIGARVLLVEDDATVRTVTEALLVEMGCEVACEGEGASALGRLQRDEAFDLVISDIIMPGGMSGLDLARAVAAARPKLPVVLTTGYAGEHGGPADEIDWPVLRKPFSADDLGAVVRQALGREAAQGDAD